MLSKNFALAAILVGLSFPAFAQDAPQGNAMDGSDAFSDKCAICHNTDPGPSGAGPNLAGLMGRKAGMGATDFAYSDAMKNSGLTWDAPTILKFIQAPAATVPGNKMALGFPGVADPGMAADIVAYLQTLPPATAPATGATTPPAGGTAPATTSPPAAPAAAPAQ